MASRKQTIFVSGMIAADPNQGGATWAVLQYLLGFRELGHDVWFVEPLPAASLRPAESSLGESENATYFRQIVREFGLEERAALLLADTAETVGLPYREIVAAAERADVLLNIAGMLTDERLLASIPIRIYLDLDPAFIQLWEAEYGIDMRFGAHNRFVTIGQNIGRAGCDVPTCGREWRKTQQPVVLSQWPVAGAVEHNAFTTVGNWRAYGSAERNGVFYGQKAHSLREFIDMPRRVPQQFSIAFAIYPGDESDRAQLDTNDWTVLDPAVVANTPARYQHFVQRSKAEIGIAKSGYVKSQCGWFSDRSVCYLASGRPVVAQETGFSEHLPTGEGLFAFTTTEDIAAAAEEIDRDYARHSAAARWIAETHFDSQKVLPRLLEAAA